MVTAGVLLLVALGVRIFPMGRYVTPDEPAWVHRSILFGDAIASAEWGQVPSTGHPGATTMWLGAASIAAKQAADPAQSAARLEWLRRMAWLSPENAEAFRRLAFFLQWGRAAVAVTTVVGLAVVFSLCSRLFGRSAALLTLGLLALDAFLAGHSGLLHTDALLATFCAISVLSLLVALRPNARVLLWTTVSGVAAGLALGTKTLAVAIVLFTAVAIGLSWVRRRLSFATALGVGALWIVALFGSLYAVYPAMWSAPIETVRELLMAPAYQTTTALTPTFFAGESALVHGPEYYLVALPYRLGPVVLAGVGCALWSLRRNTPTRRDLALLLVFAAIYAVMLAFSPKKFDRYLLPVMVVLAAAAGAGLTGLLAGRRPGRLEPAARWVPLSGLVLLQAAVLVPFLRYPLTYANPLLGGPWVAQRLIDLDWGEAAGEAATWVSSQTDAAALAASAPSMPTFASVFVGRSVPPARASQADYLVASAGLEVGREPLHIGRVGLLPGSTVYANTSPASQASYLAERAKPGDLIVADADTPLARDYPGPGTLVSIADAPDHAGARQLIGAPAPDGERLWLVHDVSAAPISTAIARDVLESLGALVATATVGTAQITEYVPRDQPLPLAEAETLAFDGQLALLEARLPDDPVSAPFVVTLRWQAQAPTGSPMYATLYLGDESGQWVEAGQPVVNEYAFPTTEWQTSEWADASVVVAKPALLPPGLYEVRLTLTDGSGAQQGAWDSSGRFRGVRPALGSVIVEPPERVAGSQPCSGGEPLVTGPFELCVDSSASQAVWSGDPFALHVTWSAVKAPETDYHVKIALRDASGRVLQQFTQPLSPHPTSQWRDGDSFVTRYVVRTDPLLPGNTYTVHLGLSAAGDEDGGSATHPVAEVVVRERDRQFDPPDHTQYPAESRFGDTISLLGFDLTSDLQDGSALRPGDAVALRLYWLADGPADESYTQFAQLIGPDGRAHGQVDRVPAGGSSPTSGWAPGQVIADDLLIEVDGDAPAGDYTITVGFYDATDGDRLGVVDGDGNEVDGQRFVLPIRLVVVGSRS